MTFGDHLNSKQPNAFDLLRLLFAIAVIYTHSYDLTGVGEDRLSQWTHEQTSASGLGVSGFFVISGFLITGSWLRSKSSLDYFRRRVKRIVPGFVVAVLITFAVVGPLGATDIHSYFRDRTAYRFLELLLGKGPQGVTTTFPHNFMAGGLNGSLWTIRIELACYALVAIAGSFQVLNNKIATVLLGAFTVLLVALISSLPAHHFPLFVVGLLMFLPSFAVGATFYVLRNVIPHRWTWFFTSIVIQCLAAYFRGFYAIFPLFGTYAILFLGAIRSPRLTAVTRYGDLSYGLYLYAFPIQQLLLCAIGTKLNPIILMTITVPITLFAAALSWRYVERPFLIKQDSSPDLSICYRGDIPAFHAVPEIQ